MSIRALYIISLMNKPADALVFKRCFPTVEKRVKVIEKEAYVPIPDITELVQSLWKRLGISKIGDEFLKWRDSCLVAEEKPVFSLNTNNGELWPFLVVEQYGLLYCCLPAVDQGSHLRPSLIDIPAISFAFELVIGMADFVGIPPKNLDRNHSKLAELHMYLSEAVPFGTPVEVNPFVIRNILVQKTSASTTVKQAAFKPMVHKGKNTLQFTVSERIRAVQYDSQGASNVWELYGSVLCKAELEGVNPPEVTLSLGYGGAPCMVALDNLMVHPCVQSADTQSLDSKMTSSTAKMGPRKIKFSPPLGQFSLCHYTASKLKSLPINGYYQMRGEKVVDILVQLKLNNEIKNSFEYCEVQMPLYHRGCIQKIETSPSHGSAFISPDKRALVWNIGQKFPSKSLEVQMKATVHCSKYEESSNSTQEDQFFVGQNAFAQLFFKVIDFTQTGVEIDSKCVHINPSLKHSLSVSHEYIGSDYKIWNSHGDSLIAASPSTI